MPKAPLVVFLSALFLAACGGEEGPLCTGTQARNAFLSDCTSAGNNTTEFCRCGWDYLSALYTCEEIGAGHVLRTDIMDAEDTCN